MGPEFWRHPTHGLKKCSERTRDFCTDHLDCCAVTPCTYCLELEFYGGIIYYGTADQSANHWTGTVNGHSFDAFWDRNYTTDECEFVVELDGEEVYRNDCYGGVSCRDSSDEAVVEIDYEEATLRWIKHEPVPLPHINDPDVGCKTWFCGSCECSCECVCVTIRDSEGAEVATGEICNVSYDCEGPVWSGMIGDYDLYLALGRDTYGECIITPTVDGVALDSVAADGCGAMSATITLDDGTTIVVACKICDCDDAVSLCCGGRNLAGTLYLRFTPGATGSPPCSDSYITLTDDGTGNWYGSGSVEVEIPDAGGEICVVLDATFHFYCDPAGPVYLLDWYFTYLGTRYPTTGWESIDRAGEDCNYPYLGAFTETGVGVSFWNGTFTVLVSEVPV